jgi:hypothetical protein
MTRKQKARKGKPAPKGYALKGFPPWFNNALKTAIPKQKKSKISRWRVHPVFVYPSDLYAKLSTSFQLQHSKNRQNNPNAYRFRKSDIQPKYARLDDDNLKDFSRQLSIKYSLELGGSRLVPVLFPNTVITGKVLPYKFKSKKELILAGQTANPKSKKEIEQTLFFLDEVNPSYQPYYINRYRIPVYYVNFLVGDSPVTVYSPTKLKEGRFYDIVATKWFEPQSLGREDKPVYYCWDFSEKVEKFDDIYKVAGKITGWDVLTPNWCYDEETISILLISLMFMEQGLPVMNTILFGDTRLGKTRILDVFGTIFGETVNQGSQQTIRGLTGGFWEEGKEGAFLSSNYVCLVDEFFRTDLTRMSSIPDANHISNLMNDTMEFLEHKRGIARSGKFDREVFFDKSFIATNNIRDTKFLRESFLSDPAPHNRFTYLVIPDNVAEKVRDVLIPPAFYVREFQNRINKHSLNLKLLRKFFVLLRNNLHQVDVKYGDVTAYLKNCDSFHKDYERKEKLYGLIKGYAIYHYVFNSSNPFPIQKKIVPTAFDWMTAVNSLNRITRNTKNIMGFV